MKNIIRSLNELKQYDKAFDMYKKLLANFAQTPFDKYDDIVNEGKQTINDFLKIDITPVIDELEAGESIVLNANIVYQDGKPAVLSGLTGEFK